MLNLNFFEYDHLPIPLQYTSKAYYNLAHGLNSILPDGEEKQVALRKLLESKDAAVRARLEGLKNVDQ